jgi:transcriptional regulator GlxA family with amidase domain
LFLIAETGLFDGVEATIHWPYAGLFAAQYPAVRANPERALVVAGARGELISSGASTSWHDLVLYLIGREVGPVAAQAVSKAFALQRHVDGLAPYIVFDPPRDHGDAAIAAAQAWLDGNASVATPVREMVRSSGLSERSFSRRFRAATGYAPLDYVQRLRVEQAKRWLERTSHPVEEIAWRVGYEDPSAFRRFFQRIAGVTPGQYRRRFAQPTESPPSTM